MHPVGVDNSSVLSFLYFSGTCVLRLVTLRPNVTELRMRFIGRITHPEDLPLLACHPPFAAFLPRIRGSNWTQPFGQTSRMCISPWFLLVCEPDPHQQNLSVVLHAED